MVLVVENLLANTGDIKDAGWIPGWERSPGGGHGNPLRILVRKISWTGEPGGLSMGLQRVRHDWVTNTFVSLLHSVPLISLDLEFKVLPA